MWHIIEQAEEIKRHQTWNIEQVSIFADRAATWKGVSPLSNKQS